MFICLVQIILVLSQPSPNASPKLWERFSAWFQLKGFPLCSLDVETRRKIFHKIKYDIKDLMRPFLCYGEAAIFKYIPIFWSNCNLDLLSYGQLLSFFLYRACYRSSEKSEFLLLRNSETEREKTKKSVDSSFYNNTIFQVIKL